MLHVWMKFDAGAAAALLGPNQVSIELSEFVTTLLKPSTNSNRPKAAATRP